MNPKEEFKKAGVQLPRLKLLLLSREEFGWFLSNVDRSYPRGSNPSHEDLRGRERARRGPGEDLPFTVVGEGYFLEYRVEGGQNPWGSTTPYIRLFWAAVTPEAVLDCIQAIKDLVKSKAGSYPRWVL